MVIIVSTLQATGEFHLPEDSDIETFSNICRSMAKAAGYAQSDISEYLPDAGEIEEMIAQATAAAEEEEDEEEDESESWKNGEYKFPSFKRFEWPKNS
tara:strand:- start:565 stop:858 length:294 start_codon:yes stop_codon:yes gene_type:complete